MLIREFEGGPALPEGQKLDLGRVYVDQILAAGDVRRAIIELQTVGQLNADLEATVGIDVASLGRSLCLPSASATCINVVTRTRLIGDTNGMVTVGDMYRVLIPYHGRKDLADVPPLERGWLVITPDNYMYHSAVATVAQALGVTAMPVEGFNSVEVFKGAILTTGAVAISLDNSFIYERTLRNRPDLVVRDEDGVKILIEGNGGIEYRKFGHGRHVVTLVSITDGVATVIDPFRLPQMAMHETIVTLSVADLDGYLKYHGGGNPRAIVFGNQPGLMEDLRPLAQKVNIPMGVVATASAYFTQKMRLS